MTASIDVLLFEFKRLFRGLCLSGQASVRQRWKLTAQFCRQFGVDISGDDKADALLRRDDGRWLAYTIDGDGPVVISKGVPAMKTGTDWELQAE